MRRKRERRSIAVVAVKKTKRRGKPVKQIATDSPLLSEWNDRAEEFAGAKQVFDRLNSTALVCDIQRHKSAVAKDLADIVDAAAWALNRGDTAALAKFAKPAREWLKTARPLVSEKTKAEYKYAGPLRSEIDDVNDAYAYAVDFVEQYVATAMKPDKREGASTPEQKIAAAVDYVFHPPLPTLPFEQRDLVYERFRRFVANAKSQGKTPDAQRFINKGLRIAGLPKEDVDRLVNTYAKRKARSG